MSSYRGSIFNHLIKEIPTLSKSTIYNTVNLFIESDLLKPIGIEDNEVDMILILLITDILNANHVKDFGFRDRYQSQQKI